MIEISPRTVFTIPNGVSIGAHLLIQEGLNDGITTPRGLLKISGGLFFDAVDGKIANLLNQSTELGAIIDASLDKKAGKDIHGALAQEGLIPKLFDQALLQQEYANSLLTIVSMGQKAIYRPDLEVRPSKAGKHARVGKNMMLGAYAVAETCRKSGSQREAKAWRVAGHIAATIGIFSKGMSATRSYAHRLIS